MSTLRELLDELTEQLGPPDESMVTEAVGELTALVHRARTADTYPHEGASCGNAACPGWTSARFDRPRPELDSCGDAAVDEDVVDLAAEYD